ncbi:hypothetical protein TSAR_006892 [Trichomalopsis sarcophagae]|uniref:Endonuclease/exonuclease/phosphatase domain-containing protein n=1 Tax=Trichomalopsis sarcophagae TaxID=543379 RepID=A0A232EDE2_9HYME|nr:hypothetical protein TSAR_006892 [Trichomalopsis sarcophagae]
MEVPREEGRQRVIIASAYLPFEKESPTEEVSRLVEYCEERGLPLVMGCDANAHHLVWGSTNTNDRGTTLLEYLTTMNLEIINRGNEPTFMNVRRREIIDITLCLRQLVRFIRDWRVSDEPSLSDHAQICFMITGKSRQRETWIRNPRRTNWMEYRRALEEKLKTGFPKEIHTIEELNTAAESLQRAITEAYEDNCKLVRGRGKYEVPWWNNRLEKLKKTTKALLKKAVKSNDNQKWIAWRSKQNEYRHAVRKGQTESWRVLQQRGSWQRSG